MNLESLEVFANFHLLEDVEQQEILDTFADLDLGRLEDVKARLVENRMYELAGNARDIEALIFKAVSHYALTNYNRVLIVSRDKMKASIGHRFDAAPALMPDKLKEEMAQRMDELEKELAA